MITGEQLDRYQEQGYLVLDAFVSDAECDELRAVIRECVEFNYAFFHDEPLK